MRAVVVPGCLESSSAGLAIAEFFCLLQEMAKTRSAHIRKITEWRKHCVTYYVFSTNMISLLDSGQQIYSHDVSQDLFHCVHLRVQAVAKAAVHGHTVENYNRDKFSYFIFFGKQRVFCLKNTRKCVSSVFFFIFYCYDIEIEEYVLSVM